jgi:probable F420-dependent oxidoreductase
VARLGADRGLLQGVSDDGDVDLGIVHFTGCSVLPDELARAVEERGFESLFYTEHTHIPTSSRRSDGRPVRDYAATFDPFVALAAAAAVTSSLQLGTAVCLLPQRDPLITAKEVSSLDQLSHGRVILGVGPGWNREEMRNHGVDPATRTARMLEGIDAMRRIWADDEAEFHGRHVDFGPVWCWPKPAQRPGPPVFIGGNGPGAEERVLARGDGWLPQAGPFATVEEVRTRIVGLRRRAADIGRGHVPVTLFGVPDDPDLLAQLADAGVDRCLAPIRSETRDEVFSRLDSLGEVRQALVTTA